MLVDQIPVGKNVPQDVNVIVEVPIGGEPIKYELDKASGALYVDRFLYTSMRYPGNYGFVPHTLSEDGDPIDVLIANTRAIVTYPQYWSYLLSGVVASEITSPGRIGRSLARKRPVARPSATSTGS